MKKIFNLLFVIVLGFSLVGCVKLDFGNPDDLNPIENNDDIPVSVEVVSVNKLHKLYVDETLQLKATVYPETVTEEIKFSSNDENIATVNQYGLVTGISEGTVKITVRVTKTISVNNIKTVEGYIFLTVIAKDVEISEVEITGPDSIYVEETSKLGIIKTPVDATYNGIWSTNNEEIAKIDQNGRLVGVSKGEVIVTYLVTENIFATKTINVIDRTTSPINIDIQVRNLIEVGEDVKAYITTNPVGSLNNVSWESSDDLVATVSQNGIITGISAGIVNITAIYSDEVKASYEITVIDNRIDYSNLENNLVDLVRTRKNSVLGVSNYKQDLDGDLIRSSLGSGFVYKVEFILKDGSLINDIKNLKSFDEVDYYKYYLLTNRHVVEGSDALKIYMHEIDREINAKLIQYDDKVDVAIVTFTYNKYIKPLILANSDELVSGRFAVAIGNPSGYEFSSTATFGIVSHPKRFLPTDTNGDGVNDWDSEYIQHDVAINPGNSGGPLFNLKGEVIGINTLKYVSSNIEGMGFSIPINVIKNLIPHLEDGEKPVRALLGVTATAVKDVLLNPKSEIIIPEGIEYGLYVVSVVDGSVANIGGILQDDIILSFNNLELTSVTLLRTELNQIIVGSNTEIEVVIYRNNEYITLNLIF